MGECYKNCQGMEKRAAADDSIIVKMMDEIYENEYFSAIR